MANSSNQPLHPLRSEPTSKPAGLHLNNRLRLSHDRGPPKRSEFTFRSPAQMARPHLVTWVMPIVHTRPLDREAGHSAELSRAGSGRCFEADDQDFTVGSNSGLLGP